VKPENLLSRAETVREINRHPWFWPEFSGEAELAGRAQELIERTVGVLDNWFEYLRANHPSGVDMAAVEAGQGKESYGGEMLDTAIKVGPALLWAEKRVLKSRQKYDVTAASESITRRWLYMQAPLDGEWEQFATPGTRCVKQVLLGTHDLRTSGSRLLGDRYEPCIGLDLVTGVFIDPGKGLDGDFNNPLDDHEMMVVFERVDPDEPVFTNDCAELYAMFPNGGSWQAEYSSPHQLLEGLHAGLDDFEAAYQLVTARG
jgi:hypothetical protein